MDLVDEYRGPSRISAEGPQTEARPAQSAGLKAPTMVMQPLGALLMYIGTTPFPEIDRAAWVPWLHAASGSHTQNGA